MQIYLVYINGVYHKGQNLKIAKLFKNGRSQAVRLPKEFRFKDDEVYIKKIGDSVILLPKKSSWNSMFESLELFSADYMEKRNQPDLQKREEFSK